MSIAKKDIDLTAQRREAQFISLPLNRQSAEIEVVDENSYVAADILRSRIKDAKKKITDRLEMIIRPAYEALQSLYAFKKECIDPLGEADVIITSKMKQYRLDEEKRIEEERRKAREEEDRREREREELERKLNSAKSDAVRRLQEKKLQRLEEQPIAVEVSAPVQASNSSTRTVLCWKVRSIKEVCKAVADGEIPEDIISIDSAVMNDYFRGDDTEGKSLIRTWPGIEVYLDLQIVSRRK